MARSVTVDVSNIELALDFEIFTGVNVPGPPDGGSIPINQRGKTFWTMLSALCRVCEDLRLPSPLPAERAAHVGLQWCGVDSCGGRSLLLG